jgi:vesicle coat complex subunit
MKVKDLIKNKQPFLKENKNTIRDVFSMMFDVIERFENNNKIKSKNEREKIDILKNIISDMLKDENQKEVIKGGTV